jgi:hypothetical protein
MRRSPRIHCGPNDAGGYPCGRLAEARWATARASPKSAEISPADLALPTIDYVPERRVERWRCNAFTAPVDVTSRKRSFPSIDSIADNSTDPARRAESGWVVSSVVSMRSALRSESNLPTARLS